MIGNRLEELCLIYDEKHIYRFNGIFINDLYHRRFDSKYSPDAIV